MIMGQVLVDIGLNWNVDLLRFSIDKLVVDALFFLSQMILLLMDYCGLMCREQLVAFVNLRTGAYYSNTLKFK